MKTRKEVAQYLARCIARSGKTQLQIAEEAGFPTPNVVSMMKSGQLKIPLARIPSLAKSLDIDARELLRHCLEAYDPELYELFSLLSPTMLVSDREFSIIKHLRAAARSGALL